MDYFGGISVKGTHLAGSSLVEQGVDTVLVLNKPNFQHLSSLQIMVVADFISCINISISYKILSVVTVC